MPAKRGVTVASAGPTGGPPAGISRRRASRAPPWGSIVDRLVHQRAQLGPERVGDRGEQLGHEDDEEVLARVDPEGGARGAAPVEVAGRAGEGRGGRPLSDSEAQTEA